MNIKKEYIIVTVLISILVSISLATAGMQSGNTKIQVQSNQQQIKLFVAGQQGKSINPEAVKNSINLFKNLSEDKKTAIKEKMAKMSQERQKNIEAVEKQIKELRLQGKLQTPKSKEEKVSQLQAIQKLALKEKAIETAKKLEVLISKLENIPENVSIEENSL